MKPKFVIVGGGGFGREVACWALDVVAQTRTGSVAGFIDDDVTDSRKFPPGVGHLGSISEYRARDEHQLLIAIGDPQGKEKVVARLKAAGASFASLIHPTAVVAANALLLEGVILCPCAVVSANAVVDDFVIVNISSSVGHDAHVGAFSTLSAHVDLTGGVVVGRAVTVGSGARVLPGRRIGDGSTIGAGAVVMRNVHSGTTVYANAAREL